MTCGSKVKQINFLKIQLQARHKTDRKFMLVLQGCIHGVDSNVMMPGGQVPESDRYPGKYVVGGSFGLIPKV